jgi:hypothetical protein
MGKWYFEGPVEITNKDKGIVSFYVEAHGWASREDFEVNTIEAKGPNREKIELTPQEEEYICEYILNDEHTYRQAMEND